MHINYPYNQAAELANRHTAYELARRLIHELEEKAMLQKLLLEKAKNEK